MGWQPHVREHRRSNRRPWYTLTASGTEYHLGTDRATAYQRAGKILERAGRRPDAPVTVAGLVDRWLDAPPEHAPPLRHWVESAGRKPLALLTTGDPTDDSDPGDVQRLCEVLREKAKSVRSGEALSAWTVKGYLQIVRNVWRWGKAQGWIACRPGHARTPQPPEYDRSQPAGDLLGFLAKIRSKTARELFAFVAAVGCRPGEARLLEWSAVNLKAGVISLKTHKTSGKGRARTLYLTPPATAILKRRKRDGRWVFPSRTGQPYTRDGLHAIAYRCGLKSTYSLRHSFAQWFLDVGDGGKPGRLEDLQKLLGHRKISTTQIYARVRDERAREVASKLAGPLGNIEPSRKRTRTQHVGKKRPGKPAPGTTGSPQGKPAKNRPHRRAS